MTSEVPVFQVFSDDPNKNLPPHHYISDHMRSVMDDLVCRPRRRPPAFGLSETR